MGDTIVIETPVATVLEVSGKQGPQGVPGATGATGATGPQGPAGTGIETLTTKGDLLSRDDNGAIRVGIGTTGQVLKVSAQGLPSWANESGAVTSVNGQTGAVTVAAAQHTHEFFNINVNGVLISGAGNANANGSYLYSGNFGDRGAYHKDKDSLIYWDGSAWMINVNGQDRYSSTQDVSFPYEVTSWSVLPGTGTAPAPSSTQRLDGQGFEEIVGQRINPTLRGDAAGKNVGTGANDVAAGNHTHLAATQSVAGFLSAADKTKLDGLGTASTKDVAPSGNASSTQVVLGNDSRLSDARTPSSTLAHASSHAAGGSDPLFDQDLNTTDDVAFGSINSAVIQGADLVVDSSFEFKDLANGFSALLTAQDKLSANRNIDLPNGDGTIALVSDIPALGAGAGEAAEGNHVHGNITSDGKIGSTAGLPVVTTTAGAITTLALGTANQVLRVNSGATGVEFADPSSGGVTGAASSASDVLGVSGANITGVDANADRIVYWNNTSNKLAYGTPADAGAAAASHTHTSADINSQTASNGHVLTANGSGGASFAALPASGISNVDSTLADVMSVSGSNLVADDGGLVDSSNPALVWDDAAGKAVWANPLRRTSAGAFYVGVAPTTTALGTRAINIQADRSLSADRIAAGTDCVVVGNNAQTGNIAGATALGFRARATSTYATCIGAESVASGNSSIAIGGVASASGAQSINISAYDAYGGNSSSGVNSVGLNASPSLRGEFATAAVRAVYWGGQTTNNTATILNLDAAATNRFTIAANTALAVDILLVARRSDVADKWLAARRFLGIRRNGSNGTALIGSVQTLGTDQSEGSPTWTFALTADDTNEALQLEVTGATGETVQWRGCAIYRVV